MQRTMLGRSGLDAPVFSVGTAPLARAPHDQGLSVLRRAYELGATWWDTSDDYGTHPLVAGAMADLPRDRLTISTKTYANTREDAERSVRQILFELGADYLDILFLHYIRDEDDFAARRGCLEVLQEEKARGRIRAIGLSSHTFTGIQVAASHPEIDVVMAPWNVRGELPSGGNRLSMEHAIAACYHAGKGVILMKVLAFGALRPIFDEAIRAAAHFRQKHALVIGVQSIRELEVDIRLTLGQPVDASIIRHLKAGSPWGKAA